MLIEDERVVLKKRVTPLPEDSRRVVDPGRLLDRVRFERHEPSGSVARFVSWYWTVAWAMPAGEAHEQHVLAHPVVNVVFEGASADVYGLQHRLQVRRLAGTGGVVGVMFRPAGFRPFAEVAMSALADRSVAATAVFGDAINGLERRFATEGVSAPFVATLDDFLAERVPDARRPSEDTTELVELVARDRSILRVDDLAARASMSARGLQRLFSDHVGASPKWVIRRYRLYDIAERAVREPRVDWAALAAELGYADQAHLTRDFTAAFGVSPQRYADRAASLAGTV
jgi:AraC-like DNA-binding protein